MPRAFVQVTQHVLKVLVDLRTGCDRVHHEINKLLELGRAKPVSLRVTSVSLVILEALE